MQSSCDKQGSEGQLDPTRRVHRRASPTEMTYIETGTLVVSRSSIAGAVSQAQFETAIRHLEARYMILQAAVEDGRFVARPGDSSALESWVPCSEHAVDILYATLLNRQPDLRKRIYSLHVLASESALDIFMLSTHAITDATSLVELHACLAYICDCIVRGVTPTLEPQPFHSPVDAAVSRGLAALPADRIGRPSSYEGEFAGIPMRTPYDSRPITQRLERIVIAADHMQRIGAVAHTHGSSVHSLLVAAFALSIGNMTQGHSRRILMRSNVDMRRRLDPHISTELVFSAITAQITSIPDLDRSLFDIARVVFNDIHEAVANGLIFQTYQNYPKTFGSVHQPPVALNISDMQAVKFHWPTQRLKVTGFEYACGLKKFPNVSVSVYDGVLVATAVYAEEFIDPVVMKAMSEGAVQQLISACRAD